MRGLLVFVAVVIFVLFLGFVVLRPLLGLTWGHAVFMLSTVLFIVFALMPLLGFLVVLNRFSVLLRLIKWMGFRGPIGLMIVVLPFAPVLVFSLLSIGAIYHAYYQDWSSDGLIVAGILIGLTLVGAAMAALIIVMTWPMLVEAYDERERARGGAYNHPIAAWLSTRTKAR